VECAFRVAEFSAEGYSMNPTTMMKRSLSAGPFWGAVFLGACCSWPLSWAVAGSEFLTSSKIPIS
jgi:hypothetical protein